MMSDYPFCSMVLEQFFSLFNLAYSIYLTARTNICHYHMDWENNPRCPQSLILPEDAW
jgi:hypothetical protein